MRALIAVAVAAIVAAAVVLAVTGPEGEEEEEEPRAAATPELADGTVTRLAGDDRFATGAAVADRLWPEGAGTVVVATGLRFPDALAAAPLAAAAEAPLLLARSDALPPAVRQAIIDLDPDEVVLMGGGGALSGRVEQEVRDLPGDPQVVRVAGGDRFETAEAAAERAGRSETGEVALVNGFDFPDAVTAGALSAGGVPVPLLLATGSALVTPPEDGEDVLLIGGTAAVTEAVASQAEQQGASVERVAGADRFATSQAVAERVLRTRVSGAVPLVLASGEDFPDALSAGAAAARTGGVLLLVPAGGPTGAQTAWIEEHRDRFSHALVIGGPAAITDEAEEALGALLGSS